MDRQVYPPEEGARHWSPREGYAPSTVLLQMMAEGWEIEEPVEIEVHWYSGGRYTEIFTFSLHRDGEYFAIPVLGNPVIRRLIRDRKYLVKDRDLTFQIQ